MKNKYLFALLCAIALPLLGICQTEVLEKQLNNDSTLTYLRFQNKSRPLLNTADNVLRKYIG